ncbi:hypothetical protein OS493_012343 [Desmophyllum pertusum]|uniref:Uncharacterized protein n=1 Tax=Desmophyllum pertusum TaxID=174260 RepID=A0A9X0D3Y1_9CNID|nr:hypothetical protein OS493_012343 [Desmophyllum pertusum]
MALGQKSRFTPPPVPSKDDRQKSFRRVVASSERPTLIPKVNKSRQNRVKIGRNLDLFREMSLECCSTTCLLNVGRDIIMHIRNAFDRMFYQAAKRTLSCRIETTTARRHRREAQGML